MKTSELAKAVGVTPETVRFYTRKGLLVATRQPENGYKIYDNAAFERLKFISHAKSIGFSLKEIEHVIQLSLQGSSPCPTVRQMLDDKIAQTKNKIIELNKHLGLMEATFTKWSKEPDTLPDSKAICCLIEDWSETHGTN